MELKDYLHLYLACECTFDWDKERVYRFVGIADGAVHIKSIDDNGGTVKCSYKHITIHLYTIDWAIKNKYLSIKFKGKSIKQPVADYKIQLSPKDFATLIDMDVDLFGLIEAGLAIDRSTINQKK